MSAASEQHAKRPLSLVVSGETRRHGETLRKLLLPELVKMLDAHNMHELLGIVQHGAADAVVVDSDRDDQELLTMLRLIRRVDWAVPVILVAREVSRRFLEGALRLEAFSIAHKPLEREELLIQLRRIMERYYPTESAGETGGAESPPAVYETRVEILRPTEVAFNPPAQPVGDEQAQGQAPAPQAQQPGRRTFYFRITHFRRQ
jgi:DNA-binding response OmpR family regulator